MTKKIKLSLIILTFLGIFLSLYLKVPSRFINRIKLLILIKNNECDLPVLNQIPFNATIIIGHLYGSPSEHNNFIDKQAEEFLLKNKNKIKNLFLTGDVFFKPTREKWGRLL